MYHLFGCAQIRQKENQMPAVSTKTKVEQALDAYESASKAKGRFDANNIKLAKRVNALDDKEVVELQKEIEAYHKGESGAGATQDKITVA